MANVFCIEVMQLNVLIVAKSCKAYFKNRLQSGSLTFETQNLLSMSLSLSYEVTLDTASILQRRMNPCHNGMLFICQLS